LGHLWFVTASESNENDSREKFILWALVIAVLLHLLVYSLWRVGQAQGWWQNFAMPRWMQVVSKAIMPMSTKTLAQEIPPQTQLTFVEVDRSLATVEPPKKPLFQGAKNTVAANQEIKTPSVMPNIDGRKEEFLKTTESAKPKPVAVAPPPPPPKPVPPQNIARQNAPQKASAPGNLTADRPSDKPQEAKGKSEAETAEQPQPQPQPAYERPRTLAEARASSGNYGPKSQRDGGVKDIRPYTSLDVKGTPLGEYIARMVDAVDDHWHKLLENQSADLTGKVVLHFRLHSDGSVSDMKPTINEVGDLLEAACERGVREPSPFGKWTPDMCRDFGDHYDITFTFYYEYY
jgi:outer membrane biosynthesis protein TonB